MNRYRCQQACCSEGQEGIFWPARRNFLRQGVAIAGAAMAAPMIARARPAGSVYSDFWHKPRALRVYRSQTGESGTYEYWRDGKIQLQAWYGLLHILRDVQQDVAMHYDPNAVDIVWAVQEWVRLDLRQDLIFRATSGARLEVTNRRTRGAAPGSEHMHGKAIDGRFEGLPLSTYAQGARFFQMGGVGLYSTHVHVDSGAVRQWSV